MKRSITSLIIVGILASTAYAPRVLAVGVNYIQKVPVSNVKQMNWCIMGDGTDFGMSIETDANGYKYASSTGDGSTTIGMRIIFDHDDDCPNEDRNENFQLPIPLSGLEGHDGYHFYYVVDSSGTPNDVEVQWGEADGSTQTWDQDRTVETYSYNGITYRLYKTATSSGFQADPGDPKEGYLRWMDISSMGGFSPKALYGVWYTATDLHAQINTVNEFLDFMDSELYAESLFEGDITETSILSVTPADEAIVATTSDFTLGFTVYVDPADFEEDMFVLQSIYQEYDQTPLNESSTWSEFPLYESQVTLLSSGESSFSDTGASMPGSEGYMNLITEIREPLTIFGIPIGGSRLIKRLDTYFVYGEPTDADEYWFELHQTREDLYGPDSDFQATLSKCNPLSNFNFGTCFESLFVPDKDKLEKLVFESKNGILNRFPIGYITRTVDIMQSETPVALPVLSFDFKEGSPVEALGGVYFDPNEIITDSGAIFDDIGSSDGIVATEEDQNLWDIVMPTFNIIAYFLLFMLISRDFLSIDYSGGGGFISKKIRSSGHGRDVNVSNSGGQRRVNIKRS